MVLKSFGLTHVQYDNSDKLGFLCALLSLSPVFIIIVYGTIIATRRDFQTVYSCIGQLISVMVNIFLKHTLKEPRPGFHNHYLDKSVDNALESEYGMPSNHAQFMFHFATYYSLQLLFRSWSLPSKYRVLYSFGLLLVASLVSYSRVRLHYHTVAQVVVGDCVGFITGLIWYIVSITSTELSIVICRQKWAEWLCIRDYSGKIGSYPPVDEYIMFKAYQKQQAVEAKKIS